MAGASVQSGPSPPFCFFFLSLSSLFTFRSHLISFLEFSFPPVLKICFRPVTFLSTAFPFRMLIPGFFSFSSPLTCKGLSGICCIRFALPMHLTKISIRLQSRNLSKLEVFSDSRFLLTSFSGVPFGGFPPGLARPPMAHGPPFPDGFRPGTMPFLLCSLLFSNFIYLISRLLFRSRVPLSFSTVAAAALE